MVKNPYRLLGVILAVGGAVLSPVFYFIIGSSALTGTGISAIILGITCIAIANARPYLSPEAAQMLLKTGIENTAALLEELGLSNKAIYMPSDGKNKAKAIIPLESKIANLTLTGAVTDKSVNRLIVRYGSNAEDMGIAVSTPGSVSIGLLENKPGPGESDIEAALNYVLTGVLDIARGVAVTKSGRDIEVRVSDAKMQYDNVWYYGSLGSPVASIAAAVTAEATGKPVRIKDESNKKGDIIIVLEIVTSSE